jgi:hypothetical protein
MHKRHALAKYVALSITGKKRYLLREKIVTLYAKANLFHLQKQFRLPNAATRKPPAADPNAAIADHATPLRVVAF